jgi:hypothetical protein
MAKMKDNFNSRFPNFDLPYNQDRGSYKVEVEQNVKDIYFFKEVENEDYNAPPP